MQRLSWLFLTIALGVITGCSALIKDPLEWNARVVVPQHHDAWVELFEMETTGVRRWRVPVGIVSCCWKGPFGKGGGGYTNPPPNFVFVRWFSLAERKYYGRLIELPADLEERMRRKTPMRMPGNTTRYDPQRNLIVGLAPGGLVVIWVMNQEQNADEILRIQAFELDDDPDQYSASITSYERRSGEYIRQHGIQYEGW